MISKQTFTKIRNSLSLFLILFFLNQECSLSQGYNHTWLVGYYPIQYDKARINFNITSYNIQTEIRKIPFLDLEGNISDANGNLLMSSNGVFVANATGDTMLNGGGLNPSAFTNTWSPYGLPLFNANLILPMPIDSTQFILFHQTGSSLTPIPYSTEIYYSIIDITHDSGLGEVISKNNVITTGLFGAGLAACKHGNGRDWWIIALKDSGNVAYKFLLSPNSIQFIGSQNLQVPAYFGWAGQPTFSPDGNKFAFGHYDISTGQYLPDVRLFDFDRCTGQFTNKMFAYLNDTLGGFGIAFSPNSQYLYASTWQKIFQYDTDSNNIPASVQTIAVNDTFQSAPGTYTDFWLMYLAANGKIYLSSGSSVYDLHFINFPDSAGLSSDIHLHDVNLPCLLTGTVPNHPNYYLGRKIGSACDSLTSITEIEHDFKFKIFPNPNSGNFSISYLLPQNKIGKLEIFDVNGKTVFKYNLPQWSTLQNISLPKLSNGVYLVKINSGGNAFNKKLIVFQQ